MKGRLAFMVVAIAALVHAESPPTGLRFVDATQEAGIAFTHEEEGLVRLRDVSLEVGEQDAHDLGFEEAAESRLSAHEIVRQRPTADGSCHCSPFGIRPAWSLEVKGS